MLTQKQIEYQRKMIELQIKRWKVPHGFINMNPTFAEKLLDMAETLLAVLDIAEPLSERKASVYLSTSDALKENHSAICKIAAYREAQKIEGVE